MAETIGQQLKQARLERHLSIEKVVESTRIRAYYIEAIEADEYDALPSPVQARAFLRLYAQYLGCSLDDLIARQVAAGGEALPLPIPAAAAAPAEADAPADAPASETPAKQKPSGKLTQGVKGIFSRIGRKSSGPAPEPLPASEEPPEKSPEVIQETIPEPLPIPAEAKPPAASQAVFTTIGQTLRQRREMLSLTVEEVERNIHIRTHYLQALEEGDFDHLPSSVQGRGMLNNYAHFLDLDVDGLLLQFAEGLQALRVERQPQSMEMEARNGARRSFSMALPPAVRRYVSIDLLVGGGLIVMLLAFAIWGTSRIIGLRSGATPEPTAPSISDILGSTPAGSAETATPDESGLGQPVPPATMDTSGITFPSSGSGVVHVVVVALQSAWVQVKVDDKMVFEGRIDPGTAYPYDGDRQIEVLTGNGAAVSILYNESDLGAMGSLGEVVDHVYTVDSILNPTPTFTPSPTITPKPSATPRPSPTVRPSPTAKK